MIEQACPPPTHAPLVSFETHVESGELAVREALGNILKNLEPLCLEIEEVSTIELVLAEALNNVVEHAYPCAQTAGVIHIRCAQKTTGLHFLVIDHGNPMPNGQTPLGLAQSVDVETSDLPEGGFGWFLIKDLAKDVAYERVKGENQLSLRLAVAIPMVGKFS